MIFSMVIFGIAMPKKDTCEIDYVCAVTPECDTKIVTASSLRNDSCQFNLLYLIPIFGSVLSLTIIPFQIYLLSKSMLKTDYCISTTLITFWMCSAGVMTYVYNGYQVKFNNNPPAKY